MNSNAYSPELLGLDGAKKYRWLVTGAAGFIGSHLVEALLQADQEVVGLDNFSTGFRHNIDDVLRRAESGGKKRFHLREGDIRDRTDCAGSCEGVDFVLHHAAQGSVPQSIADPLKAHDSNTTGFVNMLQAAAENGVRRFVYASSSAVYGDNPSLPAREERTGRPLSPYAATKIVNEIYADVWGRLYGLECIGLRYFNVFGPRQDPNGPYAAVIPRWIDALKRNEPVTIYGDGQTTRDFCHVKNVVRSNVLAALTERQDAVGKVYNIACGTVTTLNELFAILKGELALPENLTPLYEDFRKGDIKHSSASIDQARELLGYAPLVSLREGLKEMIQELPAEGKLSVRTLP
ncbi:MAG: SDR family oxidoreductase [Synergistaceae bacterium]|jgi:UDP-N-acetylglucosamine 4-epimerase|nr:SDR family oxidoreductase [Synergistaceae bacterium]